MTIIEIQPDENGGHGNNTFHGTDEITFPIPEGWAVIPNDMEIPDTFPFVNIEVDETKTPPVVTSITPGVAPEPEPAPPPQPDETSMLKARVAMIEAQQSFLEDCLLEMADEVYA